jgi:hypothetical protein
VSTLKGNTSHLNPDRDNVVLRMRDAGLAVKKTKAKNKIFCAIGITAKLLRKFAEIMELPMKLKPELGGIEEAYRAVNEMNYDRSPLLSDVGNEKRFLDGTPFTSAHRQRVIFYMLREKCGLDLTSLIQRKVIKKVIPLHCKYEQEILTKMWVKRKAAKRQPIDLVRDYFGSQMAFFFAFSGHYTNWLISLSIVSLLAFGVNHRYGAFLEAYCGFPRVTSIVYAVLTVFWGILFLLHWKRKESTLRYRWSMMGPDEGAPATHRAPDYDEELPSYRGKDRQGSSAFF